MSLGRCIKIRKSFLGVCVEEHKSLRQRVVQRRRGAELEEALLDAAWDELREHGYGGFTIESVAQRAGTSKPVVYRRWPDKAALVSAAVRRAGAAQQTAVPDTGSLRGDLIELIRTANESRNGLAAVISVNVGEYFSETGLSLADLRDQWMGDRESALDVIWQRAVERGEADPARLTRRVRAVASDLFRHDLLMTFKPLPEEEILAIVDEVVLPLVRPGS